MVHVPSHKKRGAMAYLLLVLAALEVGRRGVQRHQGWSFASFGVSSRPQRAPVVRLRAEENSGPVFPEIMQFLMNRGKRDTTPAAAPSEPTTEPAPAPGAEPKAELSDAQAPAPATAEGANEPAAGGEAKKKKKKNKKRKPKAKAEGANTTSAQGGSEADRMKKENELLKAKLKDLQGGSTEAKPAKEQGKPKEAKGQQQARDEEPEKYLREKLAQALKRETGRALFDGDLIVTLNQSSETGKWRAKLDFPALGKSFEPPERIVGETAEEAKFQAFKGAARQSLATFLVPKRPIQQVLDRLKEVVGKPVTEGGGLRYTIRDRNVNGTTDFTSQVNITCIGNGTTGPVGPPRPTIAEAKLAAVLALLQSPTFWTSPPWKKFAAPGSATPKKKKSKPRNRKPKSARAEEGEPAQASAPEAEAMTATS